MNLRAIKVGGQLLPHYLAYKTHRSFENVHNIRPAIPSLFKGPPVCYKRNLEDEILGRLRYGTSMSDHMGLPCDLCF